MSGEPQFPDVLGTREVYRPGATAHKAGLDSVRRLDALEQGAAGRPGPGVVNGSILTADTTQTGRASWVYPGEHAGTAMLRAAGSTIKAATIDPIDVANATSGIGPGDGQVWFQAAYLPYGVTLSGVGLISHTAGSFTGDNNCKIGLYTRSGSTFTRVAQSVNNTAIFTQTAGAYFEVAFSSTYVAAPGLYYIAVLFNASAITTNPLFYGSGGGVLAMQRLGLTIGLQAELSGQTDLPASTGAATATRNNALFACVV